MGFYEEMQSIATDVLREFNQGEIALVTVVPGNGPADEPGPSTMTSKRIDGAVARGVKFKYVSMGLAVASDMQVTMRADQGAPKQNGFIDIDQVRYKIKEVIAKPAAGTPSVYTCILER